MFVDTDFDSSLDMINVSTKKREITEYKFKKFT